MLTQRQRRLLAIAMTGAIGGVAADLLSGWSPDVGDMASAISVDLDSVRGLLADKPRWQYVAGGCAGLLLIPLEMAGIVLIAEALASGGAAMAGIFRASGCYLVALGAAYHGSFAFVTDIIQSGDEMLLAAVAAYWQPLGYLIVAGYLSWAGAVGVVILGGRTAYPRRAILLSPLALLALGAVLIALLPAEQAGLRSLIAVTGLNLPLAVFFAVTGRVLAAPTAIGHQPPIV